MQKKIIILLGLLACTWVITNAQQPINSIPHATIGPRNGVSYYVISTTIIAKPSSGWCGYNDLAIPNLAKYKREIRKYERYKNGKYVDTWTETVDTFIDCIQI